MVGAGVLLAACGSAPLDGVDGGGDREELSIRLPPGFAIDVWMEGLPRVRSLALGDDGTVYAGTYPHTAGVTGPVYALRDNDGDGRADRSWALRNGFRNPNGVAYLNGDLYVVDEDRVYRIPDIAGSLDAPRFEVIYAGLPSRAETDLATPVGHFWREMAAGPDGKLYVSVGTRWSYGVGGHTAQDLGDDPVYSSIVRMNPDGTMVEMFADGVRNSMGLAFHPTTGELWFTDNGPSWPFRDTRFYDIPADELNRAPRAGLHFGFPYVHAEIPDPLLGGQSPLVTPPAHQFAAHTAPLGLIFYTGSMFPASYHGQILVAEHGTEPTTPAPADKIHGNQVSLVRIDASGAVTGYEAFADGLFDPARAQFASSERYTRRPVDLLVLGDGSVLVSDDWAGVIYRITYRQP